MSCIPHAFLAGRGKGVVELHTTLSVAKPRRWTPRAPGPPVCFAVEVWAIELWVPHESEPGVEIPGHLRLKNKERWEPHVKDTLIVLLQEETIVCIPVTNVLCVAF